MHVLNLWLMLSYFELTSPVRIGIILLDTEDFHTESAFLALAKSVSQMGIEELSSCSIDQLSILMVPAGNAEMLRRAANRLFAANLDVIIGPSDPWLGIILEALCADRQTAFIRRHQHCEYLQRTQNSTFALTSSFKKELVIPLFKEWRWETFTIVLSQTTPPCQLHDIITGLPESVIDFLEVEDTSPHGFMEAANRLRDACDRKACWKETNHVLLLMSAEQNLEFLEMSLKLGLVNSINWFLLFSLDNLIDFMEPFSHNKMRVSLVVPRHVLSRYVNPMLSDNSMDTLQNVYLDWRNVYPRTMKTPQRDFVQIFESIVLACTLKHEKTNTKILINSTIIDVFELGINGQSIHTGTWHENESKHKLKMRAKDIPYTHEHAIRQIESMNILKVTTIAEKPYIIPRKLPNGDVVYEGFCVDLLKRLAQNLKFNFELHIVKDGRYGEPRRTANGTHWDGMMGEIMRGDADMAVAPMTVTALRLEAVDFTDPFLQLGISMLMKKPAKKVHANLTSFLSPLSTKVWFITLFASLLTTMVLCFVSKVDVSEEREHFSILNSVWFLACIFLRASSGYGCSSLSSKIVSTGWWLFTLVLIAQYTANFAAVLTVDRRTMPFNSFEELGNQTEYSFGSIFGGSTSQFFKYSRIDTFQKIWQRMTAMGNASFVKKNDEGVRRVLNEKFVFLMESTSLEYQVVQNCNLTKVGNVVLGSNGYSIALPKGSRWRDRLTRQILDFNEKGIILMLKRKWWTGSDKSQCIEYEEASGKPLEIAQVSGVFLLLFGGIIISFIVAICERLIHDLILLRRRS